METESITLKKKQRRSTPSEQAEVLEQYHRSGLSRTAFSRNYGIALSTLNKWLIKAMRKSQAAAPGFRELKVPQLPSTTPWAVEIIGPDGLLIRCREALPLRDLSWLLRGR